MLGSDFLTTPFSYYQTFVIEKKFGFNKSTKKIFWLDKLKGWLISILIGGGVLAIIMWFYQQTGKNFWIYAWILIAVFSLFINLFYAVINFGLILAFSLFYSSLILNPKDIAKELNKMAVTIPKIRPGKQTASFLKKTISRLALLGALFLAILVTIPNIRSSYGLGVTSLLILVGVTVETTRQIQTLLLSKFY
jgi:preprotein translocase subunit SecY